MPERDKVRPAYKDVPVVYDPPVTIADLIKEIEVRKNLNLHQKIAAMIGDCKRIPKNGWNAWNEFPYVTQADTAAMVSQVCAKYGVTIISQPIPYPRELEPLIKAFIDKMNDSDDKDQIDYLGGELRLMISAWRKPEHINATEKQDLTAMLFEFTVTNADDTKESFVRYAWGEGLDNGDKGTYKAWSGAEKYFNFKLFQIAADTEPDEGGVKDDEKRSGGRNEFDQRRQDNRQSVQRDKENLKKGDDNRGHGNENTTQPPKKDPNAKPPVVKEVERDIEVGSGKNKRVQVVKWQQVTGIVEFVSAIKETTNHSQYVELVIAGLPERRIGDNSKRLHDIFYVRHKTLFPAIATAKAGDNIVFEYEPEVNKGERNEKDKGKITQNVEDIIWIGGQEFQDGQPVVAKTPPGETASPTDLFEEKK